MGAVRALPMLLLCAGALAQEKDVEALRAKARADYEAQKPTWDRFIFDAAALTDDELLAITLAYD